MVSIIANTYNSIQYLSFVYTVKWFKVQLCIISNSIKPQSFVYTQLNDQIVYQIIQFIISHLLALSLNYRYKVHTISFQTLFVWVFKIVVDSWKLSMLLLYILWDDWPIFMISGSNEQLQQQLEYTLLKPNYHSWWISILQSDTLEECYAIKFCFKLGKNPTKTYEMLQTVFRPSVFEWHKRFKEGRESVRDDKRCERS